jgi:hypothetical protein
MKLDLNHDSLLNLGVQVKGSIKDVRCFVNEAIDCGVTVNRGELSPRHHRIYMRGRKVNTEKVYSCEMWINPTFTTDELRGHAQHLANAMASALT